MERFKIKNLLLLYSLKTVNSQPKFSSEDFLKAIFSIILIARFWAERTDSKFAQYQVVYYLYATGI